MGKLSLYWNTVRYMKPSQVCYRVCKMVGLKCSLGCAVKPYTYGDSVHPVAVAEDLDFDQIFLTRFPVEELLQDQVTFLHERKRVDWNGSWDFPDRSPLWNFNLHYFEYLLPLIAAWRREGDRRYLDKIKECVLGWISSNPREKGGAAWSAYTISLRLTNWLAVYSWLESDFRGDEGFCRQLLTSIHAQYIHLSQHLEKDLLGNHYFEDLKALVLCALFFGDDRVLDRALKFLLEQCKEQILPDGMHFELSPMYHKIILEDVIRLAAALRGANEPCEELEAYLQPMLNAAFSLEDGLERLPLFNDCGSNVSKSLDALCQAAKHIFGIHPVRKTQLPDAGYYIFEQGDIRLIVDAGKPGPEYLPGHAHCDCMSFELFKAGKPVLVNCGTYAYQCKERLDFKSTAAHNAVMVEGVEQSHCWGAFRMAERSSVRVTEVTDQSITMEMIDQKNNQIVRSLMLSDGVLHIMDHCEDKNLVSYLHCLREVSIQTENQLTKSEEKYAEEFGKLREVAAWCVSAGKMLDYSIQM